MAGPAVGALAELAWAAADPEAAALASPEVVAAAAADAAVVAGGVEPRAHRVAEVRRADPVQRPRSHLTQGSNARPHAACRDPTQALMHQDPVVAIEWHHVRDGAERNEIEPGGQVGETHAREDGVVSPLDDDVGELAACGRDQELGRVRVAPSTWLA